MPKHITESNWSDEENSGTPIDIPDRVLFFLELDHSNIVKDPNYKPNINNQIYAPFFNELDQLLKRQGPKFFKLSTRSPKDVYEYLTHDLKDDTYSNLAKTLDLLKVTNSQDILQLLTHSARVYEDICDYLTHPDTNPKPAIVLKPWIDINHRTETRLYIMTGRLLCLSQYYYWLPHGYTSIEATYTSIVNYFKGKKLPFDTCTMDVWIDNSSGDVHFIEYNPFSTSMTCLFPDDYTDTHECGSKVVFRYMDSKKDVYEYDGDQVRLLTMDEV